MLWMSASITAKIDIMNRILKRFSASLLTICLAAGILSGCAGSGEQTHETKAPAVTEAAPASQEAAAVQKPKDYASMVKLNMASETAKQEVTVKTFVDGDTTHFNVPTSIDPDGVLKARYLAINTPETTGKVEEYGKAASNFTRQQLEKAESIIIESETGEWNADSTGTRYLCWVWYKTAEDEDYRNLNIEILQNGLAKANSTANNRYGSMASEALKQAKTLKLNLYSGEKDPDFFYGEAIELTLKELRMHISDYEGMKVAFTGIVMQGGDNSVYVETYDPELDLYFGILVYYGFNLSGEGMEILSLGNEVRIVGTVQYYEAGDSWQISGLKYRAMKPDDPDNLQKLSDGHAGAFRLTDAETFVNGKVTVATEEREEIRDYAELCMQSSVTMENLQVVDIHTTNDVRSSSHGAMTFTCRQGDLELQVRTAVFRDPDGNLITEETYLGKTIDVKGVISSFDGQNQIKVYSPKDITIH